MTSPTPFARPRSVENSRVQWVDWLSVGGSAEWVDPPRQRQAVRTTRLTVTADDGPERELRITPWSGTFVVADPGPRSTLTGYDVAGNLLGALSIDD